MAIATGTAIAIGAGLSAGASVAGAKMASNANKDAAATQAASSDKALAIQKEMYDQTRADDAPYRQIGAGALGSLGYGMGIDMTPAKSGMTPQYTMSPQAGASAAAGSALTAGGPGVPQGGGPGLHQVGGPLSSLGPQGAQQSASSYIVMQDPKTGETQRVPAEAQQHYEQYGGKRIG